jgi:predicted dehydrogenase
LINPDQNINRDSTNKSVPSPSERGWGEALRIAVIGAGGFAAFAVKAFLKIPGVTINGITDINKETASQMARENNAIVYAGIEALLQDENTDLVYIATPPFLHYKQSKMALLAGKHVICEKPAALKTSEAEELVLIAASNQLLYTVNLMQRYNPLYAIVDKIINTKILGNFLHGFFENYASDENLDANHWFWDETKSGGIFIEHGVHYFDMFSGWLGKGKVMSSLKIKRPSVKNEITDRVHATVMYRNGIVNFYHGFDQPKILDRQELRLQFERGEITLYEWVPVKMKFHGLIKNEQVKFLKELVGACTIVIHDIKQHDQKLKGRFSEINYDHEITLECGNVAEKQNRYQELLINMLSDQWKWIKNRSHKRVIDESNAVESLRMAEEATQIAKKIDSCE